MSDLYPLTVTINDTEYQREVDPRLGLVVVAEARLRLSTR